MPDDTLSLTVSGIRLITATALLALIGDIRRFPSGRYFASYLAFTPQTAAGQRGLNTRKA